MVRSKVKSGAVAGGSRLKNLRTPRQDPLVWSADPCNSSLVITDLLIIPQAMLREYLMNLLHYLTATTAPSRNPKPAMRSRDASRL